MERAATGAVAALSVIWLSGCGTASNFLWLSPDAEGKNVYGGVKTDCVMILAASDDASRPKDAADFFKAVFVAGAFVVDLPLSGIGDTLTLPWAIYINSLGAPSPVKEKKRETKPEYPKVIEPTPGKTMVLGDRGLVH